MGMGTPGTYSPAADIMIGAHAHAALAKPRPRRPAPVRALESPAHRRERQQPPWPWPNSPPTCHGRFSTVTAVILGAGMGSGLILGNGKAPTAGRTGTPADRPHLDRHRRPALRMRPPGAAGEAYLSGPSLGRRYAELAGETLRPDRIFERYQWPATPMPSPGLRRIRPDHGRALRQLRQHPRPSRPSSWAAACPNISLGLTSRCRLVMDKALFGLPGRTIPILKAVLGDSAGDLGAAYLALREMHLMEF
ncbi:MAG: hypothetical protein MZV63_63250 [Marinilabiliales bacterium]|nr:hypothetical protein [Marinilabiliales bacterium]